MHARLHGRDEADLRIGTTAGLLQHGSRYSFRSVIESSHKAEL